MRKWTRKSDGERRALQPPQSHPLTRYAESIGWTEIKLMNTLQDYGIVSDNCISVEDVGNYAKAMMWLHERRVEGHL
jgi:hypothetical protein